MAAQDPIKRDLLEQAKKLEALYVKTGDPRLRQTGEALQLLYEDEAAAPARAAKDKAARLKSIDKTFAEGDLARLRESTARMQETLGKLEVALSSKEMDSFQAKQKKHNQSVADRDAAPSQDVPKPDVSYQEQQAIDKTLELLRQFRQTSTEAPTALETSTQPDTGKKKLPADVEFVRGLFDFGTEERHKARRSRIAAKRLASSPLLGPEAPQFGPEPPPASQDKPGSTGEGTKALGANQPGVPVEDAPTLPEPPLGEMYPREDNEQRVRNLDTLGEGAEHRAMAGSNADLSKEDYQVKRRAKIRQDYVERYGRPPTSFRETPEGDILPVLSAADYESTMNWLELDEKASKAKRARDLAAGKDPVGERALKLQDDRQAEQARLQEDRQSGYTQEAMRRESVKQRETGHKEKLAADSDAAFVMDFAGSEEATLPERAFADYVESVGKGAPGQGMSEQHLQLAKQGATKLSTRVSGLGDNASLGGRSFDSGTRRNVGAYLQTKKLEISEALGEVSGRRQVLESAQLPGGAFAEPEQLPQNPAFNPITDVGGARGPNTDLLRGMTTQMMTDIPKYADTGGVSVSDADKTMAFGMGVKRLAMLQSPMGPTLQPGQLGLLPKNQDAANHMQKALQNKGPIQRAVSSLALGLGSDSQRRKTMAYLVKYGGFDPNAYALRVSTQSDPVWNDIVSKSVLDGIRRTQMGQGAKATK